MQRIIFVILVALATVSLAGAGNEHDHATPAVDDARFDFLQRLAGDWVVDAGQGETSGALFECRVTAGGTAIQEREFIGTPMEMMPVYHMEGRDLVATHYCMLGNQPHVTSTSTAG